MNRSLPVVFVHGIRLSGSCWQQQQRLLTTRTTTAPDLPGHGTRRGEQFTVDAAVDAVTTAIDTVGGRAVVVGHSLGGFVSIAVAARHPDRVAALVGFGCTLSPNRLVLGGFDLINRGLAKAPDDAPWSMQRMLRRSLPAEVSAPVLVAGIAYEAGTSTVQAIRTMDITGDLAAYQGRTTFVNGSRDHFRLGERSFLSACQNGRVCTVPGAGHFLPLTHGDDCARIVDDAATLAG